MTSRTRAPGRAAAASAVTAVALLLSACGTPLEEEMNQPGGGGPADGGMEEVQALAPEPAGEQHSHQQMREALEDSLDGADITDTDDWWESLRDLTRELQKLRVDPSDCKSFVTASALPVPSGTLAAIGEHSNRQTAIYSFEDADEAQRYVHQETEGAQQCDEHTVTREMNDQEIEAEATVEEVEILSGADDAFAASMVMVSGEDTQRGLTVLLRHQSTVTANSVTLEDELSQEAAEELAAELEEEAAAVLSALTGEEFVAPEPDEDDDDGDDNDGEDADGDEESSSDD